MLVVVFAGFVFTAKPRSSHQLVREGLRLLEQDQVELAWSMADELQRRTPTSQEAWLFIARVAERSGRDGDTCAALTQLALLDSSQAAAHWTRLAGLEMRRDRAVAAEEAINKALAADPQHVDALRLQAQLNGVLGRSQDLSRCLLQLVQLRAFTMADLVILASVDPFVADPERLDALLTACPDDLQPNLAKAKIALNADRTADAEPLLRDLVARVPENWDAQALLGKLLSEQTGDRFLQWQRSLPDAADDHSRIWLARGQWLKQRGDLESASRCFWEALLREPELLSATTQLAQTLRLKAEVEAAEQFSQRSELLREIRDLATRIDEQHNLKWCPALIVHLERAGRLWEAWAWCSIQAEQQPFDHELARKMQRLAVRLSPGLPRTVPEALPGRQLDWSLVPLPDWSKYLATPTSESTALATSKIRFEDQAEELGLRFTYANSDDPQVPGRFIFESTGGGVAALDFDRDGWTDLYFPQAGPWPVAPQRAPLDALFRNRVGQGFHNVTTAAGVVEASYSQGVAAGDYDNDGFPDLYVANIGRNSLLRNNGDGTFTDMTAATGLKDELWTVSVAIADLNLDGLPDLFDVNYLDGQEAFTTVCLNDRQEPRVCRPTIFDPALDNVAINQGDGTFVSRKEEAGLNLPHGMGLGLVVADFNDDHRPDVFVANDQCPNYLLLNEPAAEAGGVVFREQGMLLGVGLDRDGFALANMGIAQGDINLDGRLDLFVTTFAQESNILYLSQPDGSFVDSTREAELRAPSFALLGFGTQFLDADCDGSLDLLILNGHIDEFSFQGQEYRMRAQCFRGVPGAKFVELPGTQAGEFFAQPRLGRGLALLDWNRDGKLDFAASDLEAPAALGTNRTETSAHALRLKCVGTASNRDAIGAKVRVVVADGLERRLQITAGDGYESTNERVLHVGLGRHDRVARIEIRWPSGAESTYENLPVDAVWLAIEGRQSLIAEPP
jgi:tetratricopeptide (TPR) repeat protein